MSRKTKPKATQGPLYIHTLDVADCTHGIIAERIAELCGVDIATARRWKTGASRVPYAAAALILGDLGAFSKSWRGWTIQDEKIISPERWTINRNDALSVPLMIAQLRDRDLRIQALEAEVEYLKKRRRAEDALEDQPHPGAIPDIAG